MKTIYKLVLKSYLGPMVLTFFIIMFVLMMNVLWRYIDELVGKGLDPGTIIELLCYATINMIPMALPLATLLAAIMTMGNLGENYELLAMKSAGMSLPKIMRPLLVVVSILAWSPSAVSSSATTSCRTPTRSYSARSTTSGSRNRPSSFRTGSSSTASTA